IAMAGDTIQMSRASFMMIHNAWVIAMGNRHELREIADFMEPFDRAMADVYAARTGREADEVSKMLDAETWMGGTNAIEEGFADELLPSDQVGKGDDKANAAAVRRLEAALRASGMSRKEAMTLISEFKSVPRDSAGNGERDATDRGARDPAALSEAAAIAASLNRHHGS
ncbi:MAG TPA: Clp protease ClpP, partial [Halomonas sp.]|nr:Clp protease ClpP [Halomonas sp.]